MTSATTARTWRLTTEGVRYPADLPDGPCEDLAECTVAEVVAVDENLEVRLDPQEQALISAANLPLHFEFLEGETFECR